MRATASFFDVLILFYILLVVPASIGVFAQGATTTALVIVLGIAAPLTALFIVAAAISAPPTQDPQAAE
ncbi:MAG TPA: hypothetical protein VF792_11010 [Ktedonobacterales bacterium]